MNIKPLTAVLAATAALCLSPVWAQAPATPEPETPPAAEVIFPTVPTGFEGQGTSEDPYLISSVELLEAFRNQVNASTDGFAGKYFKLDADIALSGIENWTPVGTESRPFSGHFDGDNHTIIGLKIADVSTAGGDGFMGLFGAVVGVPNTQYTALEQIFNGKSLNETIIDEKLYSAVVKNLTLIDVSVSSTRSKVGAVIGRASTAYVANVKVESGTVSGIDSVGGIIGRAYGSVLRKLSTGTTLTVSNNTQGYNIGGIVGSVRSSKPDGVHPSAVLNCTNGATVSATMTTGGCGGVVGHASSYKKEGRPDAMLMHNCVNNGLVSASMTRDMTRPCDGVVSGIGGHIHGYNIFVKAVNNGTVKATGDKRAGAVAGIANYFYGSLIECKNTAAIDGGSVATLSAGLVGMASGPIVVDNCSNSGSITGTFKDAEKGDVLISTMVASSSGVTLKNMTFADIAAIQAALPQGRRRTSIQVPVSEGSTETKAVDDYAVVNAPAVLLEIINLTNKSGTLQMPQYLGGIIADNDPRIYSVALAKNSGPVEFSLPSATVTLESGGIAHSVKLMRDKMKFINSGRVDSSVEVAAASECEVKNLSDGEIKKLTAYGSKLVGINEKRAIIDKIEFLGTSQKFSNYGTVGGREHGGHTLSFGKTTREEGVGYSAVFNNYGTVIGGLPKSSEDCAHYIIYAPGFDSVTINNSRDSVMKPGAAYGAEGSYFIAYGYDGVDSKDTTATEVGTFTFNFVPGTVQDGSGKAFETAETVWGKVVGRDRNPDLNLNVNMSQPTADVDGIAYMALEEAMIETNRMKPKNVTLTLLQDAELPEKKPRELYLGVPLTIDLGGHTLTGGWTANSVQTIRNGTIVAKDVPAIKVDFLTGTLNLGEDLILKSQMSSALSVPKANVSINGATFITDSVENAAIDVSGFSSYVMFNMGVINAKKAIKSTSTTNSTISGGIIDGALNAKKSGDAWNIHLSGGSYNPSYVTKQDLNNYCDSGYEAVEVKGRLEIVPGGNNAVVSFGNGKSYTSLSEAVKDAQIGSTLTLLKGVSLAIPIEIKKPITLDLYGQTIEYTAELAALKVSADLNLIDTAATPGKIIANASGECVRIEAPAVVDIAENVTLEANNNSAVYVLYGILNTRGTLIGHSKYATIQGHGERAGDVNVLGGSVMADNPAAAAIYFPQAAKLTISGGEISGPTAVYFKGTQLEISGGTLTGTGAPAAYKHNGSGWDPTGDALVVEWAPGTYPSQKEPNTAKVKATVTGGIFKTTQGGFPIAAYEQPNLSATPFTKFISGGRFYWANGNFFAGELTNSVNTVSVNTIRPQNYLAAGVSTLDGTDASGMYSEVAPADAVAKAGDSFYTSLEEAIAKAPENGTVFLLKDISLGTSLVINKSLTVDLGKHGITGGLTVSAGCTIENGSIETEAQSAILITGDAAGIQVVLGDGLNIIATKAHTVEAKNGTVFVRGATLTLKETTKGYCALKVSGENTKAIIESGLLDSCKFSVAGLGGAQVTVQGGKFNGTVTGAVVITGGKFDRDIAEFVPNGYAVVKDSVEPRYYTVRTATENDYVVQINSDRYTSLHLALNAVTSGETVTLLKDVSYGSFVRVKKPAILDLNTHTMNGTLRVFADFTLKNGKVHATGVGRDAISVGTDGDNAWQEFTVNLEESVTAISEGGCALFVVDGTVNTFAKLTSKGAYSSIQGNGNEFGNVNVLGGEITALGTDTTIGGTKYPPPCAIAFFQKGRLSISGGTIKGASAVYFKGTQLEVTGGSLIADGQKSGYAFNGDGSDPTGDALIVERCGYPAQREENLEKLSVSVTGGVFRSANASPIAYYRQTHDSNGKILKTDAAGNPIFPYDNEKKTTVITPIPPFVFGGYFSHQLPSADVPQTEVLAPGLVCVKQELPVYAEAPWTVAGKDDVAETNGIQYSFSEAVAKATEAGGTGKVTVLEDTVANAAGGVLEINAANEGKTLTVDLNGKTVQGGLTATGGTLDFSNGKVDGVLTIGANAAASLGKDVIVSTINGTAGGCLTVAQMSQLGALAATFEGNVLFAQGFDYTAEVPRNIIAVAGPKNAVPLKRSDAFKAVDLFDANFVAVMNGGTTKLSYDYAFGIEHLTIDKTGVKVVAKLTEGGAAVKRELAGRTLVLMADGKQVGEISAVFGEDGTCTFTGVTAPTATTRYTVKVMKADPAPAQ